MTTTILTIDAQTRFIPVHSLYTCYTFLAKFVSFIKQGWLWKVLCSPRDPVGVLWEYGEPELLLLAIRFLYNQSESCGNPPGGTGKHCWGEARLDPAKPATTATQPQISGRRWMDGYITKHIVSASVDRRKNWKCKLLFCKKWYCV